MKKQRDPRGGQNRKVNYNPFLRKSEERDYWLGMFIADGNVSSKKYSISMQLKDVEHIVKYRDFIQKNLKYYDRYNQAGNLMRTVLFGNQDVHEYLISLGIVPNKSKILKLKIPLNGSILRGIFDGDGSVSQRRPKITTGSLAFKHQLEQYYTSLGIEYTTTVKEKGKEIWDIWVLYNSRQQLYDLMYTQATVYLARKEQQFRAALPKVRVKQRVNSGKL